MRKTEDYPEASRCPKGGLHDYVHAATDGVTYREDCTRCGNHLVWAVGIGGQSKRWFAAHARDGLQPFGEDVDMFIREYGQKRFDEIMQNLKPKETQSQQDIIDEAKEDINSFRRTTFL